MKRIDALKRWWQRFVGAHLPLDKDQAFARIKVVYDEVKPLVETLIKASLNQPEILKWVRGIPYIAVIRKDFMYMFRVNWSGGTSCDIEPVRGGFYTVDSFRTSKVGRDLLSALGTRPFADLLCNRVVHIAKPNSLLVIGADRSAEDYFMKYGLVLREDPPCIIVNPPQNQDMFVYIL